MADPAGRRRGVFAWLKITSQSIFAQGGVPEWLKGTGCKPVGYAYVGSNPTPSTNHSSREGEMECGCSSMVEQQPSKLRTRVDRKSTRLNSSHLGISYAVFC